MTYNFKKLAMVSAVALGVAYAGAVSAAPVLTQSGHPTTISVDAQVENTLSIDTITTLNFGVVGAMDDKTGGVDTATLTINAVAPGGGEGVSYVSDQSPGASLVVDQASPDPTPAEIQVTAFPNVTLYVTYDIVSDQVTCDTCGGTDSFTLDTIADNLDAPITGVGGTAGGYTTLGGPTQGDAMTDGTGVLQFYIGASLTTNPGSPVDPLHDYADDTYGGTFDIIVSY